MRFSEEELKQPISDEQPCGEDLEYDPAFQALETALQSQAEQEMGDEKLGAEGPDWPAVAEHAKDLLARTRDMRVFVYASMAGLHLDGLPAFHQVLTALNDCMENYWSEMHPLLDPDDDNDPMMRMNVLQNYDDYERVRLGIRQSPLVELKGVGKFSLHDIELATGIREAKGDEEPLDIAIIQGAFADGNREALAAVSAAVEGSLAELTRMADIWSDKTKGYEQPGFDSTVEDLRETSRALAEFAPIGTVASADQEADAAGAPVVAESSGAINNNADVIRAIDRICEYYARNEPSNPVPYILKRAQRLVSKSFYDILQDVAPDAVSQFDKLSGGKSD